MSFESIFGLVCISLFHADGLLWWVSETSYLYLGQQWCRIISKSIDFTRFESCLLQRFPGSFTVKVEEVAEALFFVIKWIFRPNSSKIREDEYKIRNTFFCPAKSVLIVKIIFWIRQKMNLKLNFLNLRNQEWKRFQMNLLIVHYLFSIIIYL